MLHGRRTLSSENGTGAMTRETVIQQQPRKDVLFAVQLPYAPTLAPAPLSSVTKSSVHNCCGGQTTSTTKTTTTAIAAAAATQPTNSFSFSDGQHTNRTLFAIRPRVSIRAESAAAGAGSVPRGVAQKEKVDGDEGLGQWTNNAAADCGDGGARRTNQTIAALDEKSIKGGCCTSGGFGGAYTGVVVVEEEEDSSGGGGGGDEEKRTCSEAVSLKLNAILSSDGGRHRRPHRLAVVKKLGTTTCQCDPVLGGDGDDCDCASCLNRELRHVEREILFMIKQKQVAGVEQEEVSVVVPPSSSSSSSSAVVVASVVADGSAANAAAVSSKNWKYFYVAKAGPGGNRGGSAAADGGGAIEEEFEEDSHCVSGCARGCGDLHSLVMVTGGSGGGAGAGGKGLGSFAEMPATEKTTTVEGQLNALLTSNSKEMVTPWERSEEAKRKGAAGTATTKRHTNLIENQLLTLEDQFWRSRGITSESPSATATTAAKTTISASKSRKLEATIQAAVLEANEDTALLSDPTQQQTTMSDSTPVKRATVKVVTVGSGGATTAMVVEKGEDTHRMSGGGTTTSSNLSRMKRFEQFLKSLVGKKATAPSVGTVHEDGLMRREDTAAGSGVVFEQPSLKVRSSGELKGTLRPPREDDVSGMLHRPSFGSMSSLNSTVHQKFLNFLPNAATLSSSKRNLSVNNLSTIPERARVDGLLQKGGHNHHQQQPHQRCRNSRTMASGTRGLKTVSCSFSHIENLNYVTRGQQQRVKGETGAEDETMECGDECRQRDVSCWSRRLNVSKSANHLQAMGGNGPVRAMNRFRNSLLESSVSQVNIQEQCSRCSSILSLAGGTMGKVRCSDSSVEADATMLAHEVVDGGSSSVLGCVQGCDFVVVTKEVGAADSVALTCKLCLGEVSARHMTGIAQCRCTFCTDCMRAYVEFEILEGAYEISCPDAMCPAQGVVTMTEIAALTSADLMTKHNRYRLNREVELDKNRTWCPRAGCDTVCLVDGGGSNQASSSAAATVAMISVVANPASSSSKNSPLLVTYAVKCPTCEEEFCSACKKTWHPRLSCEENMKRLAAEHPDNIGIPFDSDLIKCCPMCGVAIEKDEGCAQMMCKRCKHVFCWYCLASLDDDFLLRHYDKGPCKNKLGHSRASVVWHRAQVIGIFAGFGILLLVASPLLLLAAPCIVCCKCRICSGGPKIEEEHEIDFEDPLAVHLHR